MTATNLVDVEMSTFAMSIDFKLRSQLRSIFESPDFALLKVTYGNFKEIQPSIHVCRLLKLIESNIDLFPADCAKLFTNDTPDHYTYKEWKDPFCLSEKLLICFYSTASEILYHFISHKNFLNFDLLFEFCLTSNDNKGDKKIPKQLHTYLQILKSSDNKDANSIDYILSNELMKGIILDDSLSSTLLSYQLRLDEITSFYKNRANFENERIKFLETLNIQLLVSLLSKFYPKIKSKIPVLIKHILATDKNISLASLASYIKSNNYDDRVELEKQNMRYPLFDADQTIIDTSSVLNDNSYLANSSFLDNRIVEENKWKDESTDNSFIIPEGSLRPLSQRFDKSIDLETIFEKNNKEIRHSSLNIDKNINNDKNILEDDTNSHILSETCDESDLDNSNPKSDRSKFLSHKKSGRRVKYFHSVPKFHEYKTETPFCKHCGIPHYKSRHLFDENDPPRLIASNYESLKSALMLYRPEGHQDSIREYEQSLKSK